MELFFQNEDDASHALNSDNFSINTYNIDPANQNQQQNFADQADSYLQALKDLIHEETQYLRDLNLIVLVFRLYIIDRQENITLSIDLSIDVLSRRRCEVTNRNLSMKCAIFWTKSSTISPTFGILRRISYRRWKTRWRCDVTTPSL